MNRRGRYVYGVLLAVWALIIAWQVGEHKRVQRVAKIALINRAKDISTTLGIVLRSQRRFGVISKERLESALNDLLNPEELTGVELRNAEGDVVASAGTPIDPRRHGLVVAGEHWGPRTVTLVNLVDLGMNVTADFEGTNPPIVLPPRGDRSTTNRPSPSSRMDSNSAADSTDFNSAESNDDSAAPRPRRSRGEWRPPFGRPFWMSEQEYREAIQKRGVHSFMLSLSTAGMQTTVRHDLWTRLFISLLATVSVVGFGIAWRNLSRTSELEVRLVRASQQNLHLKEMNLAAAGLAHETRNPLNIIRGLAQMISKRDDVSPEIREKSRQIVDESDRVTAQLNEFINYSKPREVRRAIVPLGDMISEITRALSADIEEKKIRVTVDDARTSVAADEQLLRQALFNLMLNATQAVDTGGEIHVVVARAGAEASLEVRDNGPGVPAERRTEIFKPYFTTNEKGTGLGLAIVQQIVLAHGWEIECLPNEPCGAIFRITHLKVTA